jgi:hypothetical protein
MALQGAQNLYDISRLRINFLQFFFLFFGVIVPYLRGLISFELGLLFFGLY